MFENVYLSKLFFARPVRINLEPQMTNIYSSTAPRVNLSTLPTEILLEIYSYISDPPEKVIWPLICKRFYTTFKIPPWYSWSAKQQHEILLLFERCSFSHARLAVCHGPCYMSVQDRKFFARNAVHETKGPRCWQCAKYLWISPEKQMSYADIMPVYRRSRYEPVPPMEEEDKGVISRLNMWELALRCRYELITVPEGAHVSLENMAVLLSKFTLPACPHMGLNDPRVVKNYDPETAPIQGPALIDAHAQNLVRCEFPGCRTIITWLVLSSAEKSQSDSDETGSGKQKTIYLRTIRILGDLNRFANPAFLAQLIVPNKDKLKDHWRRCVEWRDSIAPMIARQYAPGSQRFNAKRSTNTRLSSEVCWDQISRLLMPSPLNNESDQIDPLFWLVYNPGNPDAEWMFSETDIPAHLSKDRSNGYW
ncbi:hypothetical protein FQN54_002438 [Arachnomyces sp. PD_36]|nr:hypothetical protein FQN54_002438 [Arachnomyces sp. PD_36]